MRSCSLLRYFSTAYCSNNRFFLVPSIANKCLIRKCSTHVRRKDLKDQIFSDLRKTETVWRRHRNQELLKKYLYQSFVKNDGLLYIVNLLIRATENRSCSTEVVFSMLMALEDYLRINIKTSPVILQWKELLISLLMYKYYTLIQPFCSIFRIIHQVECFKEFIQDLLQQNKLIEAAYCISALNLQHEYPIEKVLLPLLLEGKLHPAIIYMTGNSDLQLCVSKLLDSRLKETYSGDPVARSNSKNVYKALTTIVNVFKISPVYWANLYNIRCKGAIKVLIKRRVEQSLSEATFEEIVKGIVGENHELKDFLISKLMSENDARTAERMAEKLNVSRFDVSALSSSSESEVNSKDLMDDRFNGLEDIKNDEDHLVFKLNLSDIKLISRKEEFISSIDEITQNYDMIGIDSEWKPHFGLSQERLSLIQIAVWNKVFIFDLLSLNEHLQAHDWDKFMDDIFANPNILKLGCGIMSDVHMILDNNKGSKGKPIRFSHILDMAIFYKKLQEVYPEEMNCEGINNIKGLSALCEIILGKPLNKEERLCDWEKRPLKEAQLEYAALDAHCLLQMFEKLKEDAALKDMNFSHLTKVAIVLTTGLWKPKKRVKGHKSGELLHVQTPVPIQQFKIVIDPKLESLGQNLQQFGADVLILKSSDTPENVVQISNSEKRIIICLEELWNQVRKKVPDGYCYNASREDGESITVAQIFLQFNVQLEYKSITV